MISIHFFQAPDSAHRFGRPGSWEHADIERAAGFARQLAKTPEVIEVVIVHPEGTQSWSREGGYAGRWQVG